MGWSGLGWRHGCLKARPQSWLERQRCEVHCIREWALACPLLIESMFVHKMWNIQSQLCTHGMCGPVDCGIVWSENVEGFIVAMSTVAMCTKSYLPIPIVCRIQVRWRAALQMVLASGIWLTMPDRKKVTKFPKKRNRKQSDTLKQGT